MSWLNTITRFFLLLLLFSPWVGYGQGTTPVTIFEQMAYTDVLRVTVTTDLQRMINDRNREEYQSAVWSFVDREGQERSYEVRMKPRGKFRQRICNFPPIKIKFDKDELEEAGLNDHNDIKLVTHCIEGKVFGNENVLKEYLAYQLFEEMTPLSYRTQLLEITYRDAQGGMDDLKRYGMVLEDTDEMAERVGGEECDECRSLPDRVVDPEEENLMAMFQYMIGNVDWNCDMLRNIKAVRIEEAIDYCYVPYDFDFSGFVRPSYVLPRSEIGQSDVTERFFLGQPASNAIFQRSIHEFLEKEDRLKKLVKDFKPLKKIVRNDLLIYMDSFFEKIKAIQSAKPESYYQQFNPPTQTAVRQGD